MIIKKNLKSQKKKKLMNVQSQVIFKLQMIIKKMIIMKKIIILNKKIHKIMRMMIIVYMFLKNLKITKKENNLLEKILKKYKINMKILKVLIQKKKINIPKKIKEEMINIMMIITKKKKIKKN